MGILITVGITVLVTLTYAVGWSFWMDNGRVSPGSTLAFVFSPVTVPLSVLVLIVAYP